MFLPRPPEAAVATSGFASAEVGVCVGALKTDPAPLTGQIISITKCISGTQELTLLAEKLGRRWLGQGGMATSHCIVGSHEYMGSTNWILIQKKTRRDKEYTKLGDRYGRS